MSWNDARRASERANRSARQPAHGSDGGAPVSEDWWAERQQNRRIEALQGEVEAAYSYAASRSRALQSKLSQVQGTLERRLDRLATSFDAFVELSDIRMDLAVFDQEAAVRHRTRRLLMGLARGA